MYSWDSRCLDISASFNTKKNGREGTTGRGQISLGGTSPGKDVIAPQPADKETDTRSLLRTARMCFSLISSLPPFWSLSIPQGHEESLKKWPQGNHVSWPGNKEQLCQGWTAVFSMLGFISYGSGSYPQRGRKHSQHSLVDLAEIHSVDVK